MASSGKMISVIIPIYNPGDYLFACLDSITKQTYTNLEIILVNDGSTDNSLQICREYAAQDHRITVYDQKNSGVSAARNKGIEHAHGDYFSFIDSDDYLELNTYEVLMEALQSAQAEVICFEYFINYPNREIVHSFKNKEHYGIKDRHDAMKELVCGVPFTCTKLFKREAVEGLRFQIGLARGEDGVYNRLALDRIEHALYIDIPLLHYVQSEQSAVRGAFRINQLSILNTYDDTISFYQDKYADLAVYEMRSFLNLAVSLFCDMYIDKKDLRCHQQSTHCFFKRVYHSIDKKIFTKKDKIKFAFFNVSPYLFSWVHSRKKNKEG